MIGCYGIFKNGLGIRLSSDQNLPFRKFQPEKWLPKILGDLFRVKIRKNGQLYHFLAVRKS